MAENTVEIRKGIVIRIPKEQVGVVKNHMKNELGISQATEERNVGEIVELLFFPKPDDGIEDSITQFSSIAEELYRVATVVKGESFIMSA